MAFVYCGLLFVSILHLAVGKSITLVKCKEPHVPFKGDYGPKRIEYWPGDVVQYFCETYAQTDIHGDLKRMCQGNGTWSGQTPICDKPAAYRYTSQSATVGKEAQNGAQIAVDGNPSSCTNSKTDTDDHKSRNAFWMGVLQDTASQLLRVMVFMPKGNVGYEVVLVNEDRKENLCGPATVKKIERLGWMTHTCSAPNNTNIYAVIIRSTTASNLKICELRVHAVTEPVCDDPKTEIENGRLRVNRKVISLECDEGFDRSPHKTLHCIKNGVWTNGTLFCLKSTNETTVMHDNNTTVNLNVSAIEYGACPSPPVPLGGFVTFLSPFKNYAETSAAFMLGNRTTRPDESDEEIQLANNRSSAEGNSSTDLDYTFDEVSSRNIFDEVSSRNIFDEVSSGEIFDKITAKFGNVSDFLAPGLQKVVGNVSGFLSPGLHQVGSRAVFECESRHYSLVGSRSRRCSGGGKWSGREPNCLPVCGQSFSKLKVPNIVHGKTSKVGQWPWQAGLVRFMGTDVAPGCFKPWCLVCGGSLISESWVMTAAHCVTNENTGKKYDKAEYKVYLGKEYRDKAKDDELVQIRTISEIIVHPDYDPSIFDSDIALLHLDKAVKLTSRVGTICLPTEETSKRDLQSGKKGLVSGWGDLYSNRTYSPVLKFAVLPVVSMKKCKRDYKLQEFKLTITNNMFCAGYKKGYTDSCQGDSGGPFVFYESDKSGGGGRWVQEGIVSWGSPLGCARPRQYAGFTLVSKFLKWIQLYV